MKYKVLLKEDFGDIRIYQLTGWGTYMEVLRLTPDESKQLSYELVRELEKRDKIEKEKRRERLEKEAVKAKRYKKRKKRKTKRIRGK